MKLFTLWITAFITFTITLYAQNGGYALEFGGTKIAECSNSSLVNITGKAITVEAWIYPTSFSPNIWENSIVTKDASSTTHGYCLRCGGNGQAEFYISETYVKTGFATSGINALELNKWTHLAGTYDGINIKLYINGKLSVSNPCNYDLASTDYVLKIGNNRRPYLDRPFIGKIDEVRLWDVARTEAEIKANMFKEIGTHSNLKAYYKMSDGSGNTLTDNSGEGNNCTLYNSPIWKLSGAFAGPRQALDFESSKLQCVNFNTPSSFQNLGTGSYTIEAWIKTSYTGRQQIFGNWSYSYGAIVMELHSTGNLRAYVNSTGYNSTKVVADGKWHHVVTVRNFTNGTLKMYVDGFEIYSSIIGSTSFTGPAGIHYALGANLDGVSYVLYFNGSMDDVRIWNAARTETEIRENMCKTLIGNETGLVAYYRMDQKDGTILYDQTANAINGTLSNMDPATDWISSTAFNTWLGGESSASGTAANWSSGAAPTSTDNLGIYKWTEGNELNVSSTVNTGSMVVSATANPTLDADINTTGAFIPLRNVNLKFTTNNAIGSINNPVGNELIVPADTKVTVSTSIDNSGKIILKSNDTNSAQIKNTGTAPTPGTVVLRKDLKKNSGWYFVSFPFDVTLSNIKKTSNQTTVSVGDYRTATGPIYDDLYIIEYNGIRRDDTGTATATNSPNWDAVTSGTLAAKKGYAIRVMADLEIDFIGTTNADMFANTDKSTTVSNQSTNASAIHHGWNLVGIPFTTAFNINNLSQGSYFYVYDQSNQNYMVKEKNVDTYQLNAFGAFFMQASATNLSFANAGRTLKAPSAFEMPTYSKIDMAITNGTYTDNTQIRLMADAQSTYEINKDAAKMLSMNSAVPQLWTKAETFDVAINALPENTKEVKLSMRLGSTGSYTIRLNDISQNQTAVLVDNLTGSRINLAEEKSYSFSSNSTGTISDRFKILTATDVSTDLRPSNNEDIIAKINNGNLIFSGLKDKSTVRVYDTKLALLAVFTNVDNAQKLKLNNITNNLIVVVVESNCGINTFKLYTHIQ